MPSHCLGRIVAVAWMTGCLSYDAFMEQVVEKKCEEDAVCGSDESSGDCRLYRVPGDAVCNYDPEQARRCLAGVWACNDDLPDFSFAEPPPACDLVCTADP